MPSLSAFADPFVPMTDHLSITYYFDQYKFLKTLESTATSDPAFLSKIKSEFYQLKHQLDLTITTAGSLNSPAPTSTTSSIQASTSFSICNSNSPISSSIDSFPSSLTRQQKRQLRAATFNACKTDSFKSNTSRKPTQSVHRNPADHKHKCFLDYLDMVNAGKIILQDPPNYLPVVVPTISPSSTSVFESNLSSLPDISSSSSFTSSLPVYPVDTLPIAGISSPISKSLSRRPPSAPLPKIISKINSLEFSDTFIRPCHATSDTKFHSLPSFLTARRPISSRSLNLPTVSLLPWSPKYVAVYDLFSLKSFNADGCLIQKSHKFSLINSFVDSLNDYFNHCLLDCVFIFFNDHLKCCVGCGSRTHDWFSCTSSCPDCPKDSHSHIDCPKLMLWLHDPETPHHLTWMTIVRNYLCKQESFPSFSS